MVTWFYFIAFAASLVLFANFLFKNKRIDTLYVMFGSMILFNTGGCWLIAASTTVEQAIWANAVNYIGGCYTPVLLALVLAKLCDMKLPRLLVGSMSLFATFVIGCVLTIGHSGIYYKNVSLAEGNGYHYLVKEYGPLHAVYPVFMFAIIPVMLYLIVYAIRHRTRIPTRTVVTIAGLCVAILSTYLITRLVHSKIEWLTVWYLVAVIVINQRFRQMNMYDITANITRSIEKLNAYGCLVFDMHGNFINANDYIKSCFPEINDWRTERPVEPSDSVAYQEIVLRYQNREPSAEAETIHLAGRYYAFSVRDIIFKNRKVGDLIELIDRTEEHNYTAQIEDFNSRLKAEVEQQTSHISTIKDKMVIGMAAMVESRDNSTGGHINRTSEVVRIFSGRLLAHAEELALSGDFLEMVTRAAPMHDLGKIAVDDAVLRKTGKFTPEEYDEMKKHSAEGAKTVRNILQGVEEEAFVQLAVNIAHYHHEKWNGKGYPCGLAGEEIPIEARIMALADVFDALVSKRCYKEAFDYDTAFGIIENDLGSHFDPVLGRIFLECRPELETMYDVIRAEDL